jgi:hypothetical protein
MGKEKIDFKMLLNFIDRNIAYRQLEEIPKHKEGTLYYNKYLFEIDIFYDMKKRVLRDELKREPTMEELQVLKLPESMSKYF